MISRLLIVPILTISLLNCNEWSNKKGSLNSTSTLGDTTGNYYSSVLKAREKASSEKQMNHLGVLLHTISFEVKTENKEDFEDGIIPWASLEKPDADIPNLIDGDEVVISENKITIIIDYPLMNEFRFDVESKNAFTRKQLLKEISSTYYKIYEDEENSAKTKTIPVDKRIGLYNRNQTDGKYGIWGHDISDLVLSEIMVYRSTGGQIILALYIQS
jgi:hypothetical protein